MKAIIPSLLALILLILTTSYKSDFYKANAVNPVIGDVSFVETFGTEPSAGTSEQVRIMTHLAYVEKQLRKKDVSHLNSSLQERRSHILNLLHEYWLAGNFPKNYDYPGERKPCFIDRDGNICAVGYLVEQTAGRSVAEKINSLFQYAEIGSMRLTELTEWVASSGLTLAECAMIQPGYGGFNNYYPEPDYNYVSPAYGISTAAWSGVNVATSAINMSQIMKGSGSKAIPIFGLVSGAEQITVGIWQYTEGYNEDNGARKNVSLLNIGMGTTTLLLSGYNLIVNRPRKVASKNTAWNLHAYPTDNNSLAAGFSLRHRF